MTGMVMLHQVSFIFYFFSTLFFYIIIHLNTPVLETGLLIGCGKKWEILRHFQGKLCGKKGLLCGKLYDFLKLI